MKLQRFVAFAAGTCVAVPVLAIDTPEVEPNDNKGQATVVVVGMVTGDTLSGMTTGTSTTGAGALASADYFRVRTAPAPLGIYRHRLQLNSATLFQAVTIRNVAQIGAPADTLPGAPWDGVIGTFGTTDAAAQTAQAAAVGGVPPRTVQWYGFGKQEQIYYRVTGTTSTTGAYSATLETAEMAPNELGSFFEGQIRINFNGQGHSTDTDCWVYDADLNAIPGFGNDDSSAALSGAPVATTSTQSYLVRHFTPGTYHLAVTNFSFLNNQPSPSDDNFRSGSILDFPDAAVNSSAATNLNVSFTMSDSVGTNQPVPNLRAGAFEVTWFRFTVVPVTFPTPPSGSGTATPGAIPADGTTTTTLAVAVTPGTNPPSTGLGVTVDCSSLGSGTATLLDNGLPPDLTAGDNTFTGTTLAMSGTPSATYMLPFTITDGEGRSGSGNIGVNVFVPPTVSLDFGDMSSPNCQSQTFDLAASEVRWFLFNLSTAADAAQGTFLDIDTENTAGCVDTEIGVYRADGTLRLADDDDGSSLLSQASFGVGGRPVPPIGPGCTAAGLAYNGRDGVLNPGEYYLAVSRFPTTHGATAFGVTSTGVSTTGMRVNICSQPPSTPPVGVGSTTPAPAPELSNVRLEVTVTPGMFPSSTGLAVFADLSSLGGSAMRPLLDDGLPPDAVAGDNIFSAGFMLTLAHPAGSYPLPFTVTDLEGRSGSGVIPLGVAPTPGACCFSDGTCQMLGPIACRMAGGVFRGPGSDCGGLVYQVDPFPAPFADISAVGTLLPTASNCDDCGEVVNIGFPFTFFGSPFVTVGVSSNGYLNFGGGTLTDFTNDPIPSVNPPDNLICPLWEDLRTDVAGDVYTFLDNSGGPGNRRFLVSWQGVVRFANNAHVMSFQVVLREADNRIELRYGAIQPQPAAGDYSVGVENAGGTRGRAISAGGLGAGNTARLLTPHLVGSPCAVPCQPVGDVVFDQIDPGMLTGQVVSQATNCQGCLVAASVACMDEFEINGLLGLAGTYNIARAEALVRNTGITTPLRWRFNLYTSAGAGANLVLGNQYTEEFNTPACTINGYDPSRYPGFDLVAFDVGTGFNRMGSSELTFGVTYWMSIVAVTPGDADDIVVALTDNNMGPSPVPNAFQARYVLPMAPLQTNQNAGYRLRSGQPPCAADFNGDGNLDPDDLSDFITCFFTEVQLPGMCPQADYNADGNVDPDDLSDYITAFFTGC